MCELSSDSLFGSGIDPLPEDTYESGADVIVAAVSDESKDECFVYPNVLFGELLTAESSDVRIPEEITFDHLLTTERKETCDQRISSTEETEEESDQEPEPESDVNLLVQHVDRQNALDAVGMNLPFS